jgi:transposase, IS6 family
MFSGALLRNHSLSVNRNAAPRTRQDLVKGNQQLLRVAPGPAPDRGVEVDHTTTFRWIQAYAVDLEKRLRPHLRMCNGSWRVDETYVKVKGRWMYLYRAVDGRGQTFDFLLSAKRDAEAVKRFFRKALSLPHTVNPRTITVDKNAAYPKATAEMKKDGKLWRRSRLRQVKYLNNNLEQDHRNVKRLTDPGLGFGNFWTARRTLAD